MTTGHNFSRGKQTMYAYKTLESSRQFSGHNSFKQISVTAVDKSSSSKQYTGRSRQAVSPLGTISIGESIMSIKQSELVDKTQSDYYQ